MASGTNLTEEMASKTTIVLSAPRLELDTCLQVFDTDFHVHSVLLKIHSAFFYKFLDSPDKVSKPKSQTGFIYSWVTQVDEDGSWSLVSEESEKLETTEVSQEFKDKQTIAFHKLLHAVYSEPYTLECATELRIMTELADYYCALPILSKSLWGALSLRQMKLFPYDIDIAYKLRNAELFRDCVILVAGIWVAKEYAEMPSYVSDLPIEVRRAVKIARGGLAWMIVEISRQLRSLAAENPRAHEFLASQVGLHEKNEELPAYYRHMWFAALKVEDIELRVRISRILDPVFKNNMGVCQQSREQDYMAGLGHCEGTFLCAEFADEDLPWNLEEKEW